MEANVGKGRRAARTRDQLVALLRRAPSTVNALATALGVTPNAVRGHLSALEREGLVRQAGLQRGRSRPAVLYEIEPRAESSLSKAYIPFLAHLLRALAEQLRPRDLDALMRAVGRRMAHTQPRPTGVLRERIGAAERLFTKLGAVTAVERKNGTFLIHGYGCLLAEAVHGRPEVCRAVESFLADFLAARVRECCTRAERPHCCFEIAAERTGAAT